MSYTYTLPREEPDHACPTCGGPVRKNGRMVMKGRLYQRFRCTPCEESGALE